MQFVPAKIILCSICLLLLQVFSSAGIAQTSYNDSTLKAVFSYKFTKFTQWPETKLAIADQSLNLCILAELNLHPIFTISDIPEFSHQSGMITLLMIDQQLRFEINATAIDKAGLSISLIILELGIVINPVSKKGKPLLYSFTTLYQILKK